MQKNLPLINPVVVLRKEFDDWAVLFNPDTAEAVGINPLGVAVWEQMADNRIFSQVIDSIRQQYRDVPGNVEEEVESFISDLAERGFVGIAVEKSN